MRRDLSALRGVGRRNVRRFWIIARRIWSAVTWVGEVVARKRYERSVSAGVCSGAFLRRDCLISFRVTLAPAWKPRCQGRQCRSSHRAKFRDTIEYLETSDTYHTTSPPPTSPTMSSKTKTGKPSAGKGTQRSAIEDVVAREYTIHLHKRVRSV